MWVQAYQEALNDTNVTASSPKVLITSQVGYAGSICCLIPYYALRHAGTFEHTNTLNYLAIIYKNEPKVLQNIFFKNYLICH